MVKISFLLNDNEITSYLKNEEGIKPIKIENNVIICLMIG